MQCARSRGSSLSAVLLAAALVLGLVGCGREERADSPPSEPAGSWRAMAESPLPGRSGRVGVWAGKEMLVWGGIGTAGPFGDGAA